MGAGTHTSGTAAPHLKGGFSTPAVIHRGPPRACGERHAREEGRKAQEAAGGVGVGAYTLAASHASTARTPLPDLLVSSHTNARALTRKTEAPTVCTPNPNRRGKARGLRGSGDHDGLSGKPRPSHVHRYVAIQQVGHTAGTATATATAAGCTRAATTTCAVRSKAPHSAIGADARRAKAKRACMRRKGVGTRRHALALPAVAVVSSPAPQAGTPTAPATFDSKEAARNTGSLSWKGCARAACKARCPQGEEGGIWERGARR